jgi:uncharacterized membrane protein (UPF0127 family)
LKTVRALNQTKGTVVAANVSVAKSIWARFWGLMGKSNLADDAGLFLTPCSSIHMFFMRFPLDVVFLDKENRVVKVVEDIKPWRMSMGGGGHSALEIPTGAAGRATVAVGDVIEFEPAV